MDSVSLFGLTCPLLTKSDGSKMGKTESGAIWLDAEKTSPYEFFQYWRNVADDDVSTCLRMLTDVTRDEIEGLDAARAAEPHLRASQQRLAEELTRLVHGELAVQKAQRASEVLFGAEISDLDDHQLLSIFQDVPRVGDAARPIGGWRAARGCPGRRRLEPQQGRSAADHPARWRVCQQSPRRECRAHVDHRGLGECLGDRVAQRAKEVRSAADPVACRVTTRDRPRRRNQTTIPSVRRVSCLATIGLPTNSLRPGSFDDAGRFSGDYEWRRPLSAFRLEKVANLTSLGGRWPSLSSFFGTRFF